MNLITIDEARAHARIDGDVMDAALALAVAAANASVWNYLKRAEPYPDDAIPADVKMAALLMAGNFIRDPDAAEAANWTQGYLPWPVINILYPYRDPAMS
ncbi:hypothetical protein OKW45_001957 [Paraburkholderia sp. WSM4175]|uniref:head-tail connector protein n=1 Tax=Paraburkholderia sp. WSM4175 TaxID=2991072 RepID=UPI003D25E53A